MESEWREYRLGDICSKIGSGATPTGGKESYSQDGDFALIRSQNILDFEFSRDGLAFINKVQARKLNNVEIEEDDILINITGDSVARACKVPKDTLPARVNQHVSILRANKHVLDSDFLLYSLLSQSNKDKLLGNSSAGATRNALTKSMLEDFTIIVPKDVKQQKEISRILRVLDDKLKNNRKVNQTLESIAQTLFKSWFVDFDPVKAKVAAKEKGEDPILAAMQTLSGKTAKETQNFYSSEFNELRNVVGLFPDEFEDGEFGLIPNGWKWTAFGELLEKTVGGDWGQEQPDEKHTEEVRIIRGTDIPTLQSGKLDKIPTRFVEVQKLKTRKLQLGDIVIEISGGSKDQPTGRSIYLTQNIIDRLGGVVEPASFCRLFRPKNKEFGMFLGQHLQYIYNDGKTWLYQNQSTGISNFQTTIFLEREFLPVADNKVLKAFFSRVKPIIDKMTSNENVGLSELRDSLLPKLLSGELILKEV